MLFTVQMAVQRGARKPLECLICKHIMVNRSGRTYNRAAGFEVARRFHFVSHQAVALPVRWYDVE
jgi:hypothetical protein